LKANINAVERGMMRDRLRAFRNVFTNPMRRPLRSKFERLSLCARIGSTTGIAARGKKLNSQNAVRLCVSAGDSVLASGYPFIFFFSRPEKKKNLNGPHVRATKVHVNGFNRQP
jgi:hypothetical protein